MAAISDRPRGHRTGLWNRGRAGSAPCSGRDTRVARGGTGRPALRWRAGTALPAPNCRAGALSGTPGASSGTPAVRAATAAVRAGRAGRVAAQRQFGERASSASNEQPPHQRIADLEEDLDRLVRLEETHDPGHDPEDARDGAARRELGRRRGRVEAAVAGSLVGDEDRQLALERNTEAWITGIPAATAASLSM